MKFSEAIFVCHKNLFHSRRGTLPFSFERVNTGQISVGLGAAVKHGKGSIFERLGFKNDNGEPIKITTHQFRHWLNTIAQRGGLSQLDIAKWSGRKDIRQNEDYDHVTADEMIMLVREIDDSSFFGPLAEAMKKMPLSREQFLEANFPTAHITEYGFCVHDYSMMPCQKHRDCINCTEHVCIKGDREKTHRIRETLKNVERQIIGAEEALKNGTAGADRWFEHHTQTAARLRGLVDIFEDPIVPIGSVIQLALPNEFSQISNAVDDRIKLGDDNAEILKELRALIGEGE
ncbi:hypothetical protein [Terasakiella sp.]|uniref:hypothetical protein n=1 Tax=Terasakiella sp. TaxID=2034861 RepID=UPI003AA7F7BA